MLFKLYLSNLICLYLANFVFILSYDRHHQRLIRNMLSLFSRRKVINIVSIYFAYIIFSIQNFNDRYFQKTKILLIHWKNTCIIPGDIECMPDFATGTRACHWSRRKTGFPRRSPSAEEGPPPPRPPAAGDLPLPFLLLLDLLSPPVEKYVSLYHGREELRGEFFFYRTWNLCSRWMLIVECQGRYFAFLIYML